MNELLGFGYYGHHILGMRVWARAALADASDVDPRTDGDCGCRRNCNSFHEKPKDEEKGEWVVSE